MRIEGSTPLVTGGNRGIGEAFVRAFLAADAKRVYVGARDPESAAHLVAQAPERVVAVELDITRDDQVAAAARRCDDVDILVNNAGVFANELLLGAETMEGARDEMEVNYFGTLRMCRAFAPVLGRNGGGAITSVLSAAALVGVPFMGGYSPSKFASRALTAIVRAELEPQGTEVSCLIVGSVDTRMAEHVEGQKESPADIARAGLRAIAEYTKELDTDPFAAGVRAGLEEVAGDTRAQPGRHAPGRHALDRPLAASGDLVVLAVRGVEQALEVAHAVGPLGHDPSAGGAVVVAAARLPGLDPGDVPLQRLVVARHRLGADVEPGLALADHLLELRDHVLHLVLDRRDQRVRVGVRTVEHEEVREAGGHHALVGLGAVAPGLVDVHAVATNQLDHRGELRRLESRRQDQRVDLARGSVAGGRPRAP